MFGYIHEVLNVEKKPINIFFDRAYMCMFFFMRISLLYLRIFSTYFSFIDIR